MSITEFSQDEVRIRQGSNFTQIPTMPIAGEQLAIGTFVLLSESLGGTLMLPAGQDDRVTHFVQKAGVARLTADEVANKIGIVEVGEPVIAHTGIGTVRIPFADNVDQNQALTVNSDGYAVPWTSDTGAAGAFIIGHALQDVALGSGEVIEWGDAFVDLPAKYSPSVAAEEKN